MNQEIAWDAEAEQELARRLRLMGWEGEQALMLRRRVEAIAQEGGSRIVTVADLDEARARSMGGGPREMSAANRALEWDPAARRDLEKETIYLRERLRHRVEEFTRESGKTRVTLDLVTQVRRMPSPMAAMRMGQAAPAVEQTPVPPWPVTFGAYYLKDPEGSVAICTLASETLMDELSPLTPPGVAIVGRVYTENYGVEKVVTNIVANPRLRTLILCGTESRHRVGQTLIALHANGRDDQGKVIGSESPQPIVRSLSEEAVSIYREKLTIVDLRDQETKETILAEAREAASTGLDPWHSQWEPSVPIVRLESEASGGMAGMGGMAGRFTPDSTGLFLIGLGPWGKTIEMEHYTHEGRLDYRIVGASAEALCRALLENGLVGDYSHALYVGREAQKAEVALRCGLEYEQDRQLNLPLPGRADQDRDSGMPRSM